VCSIFKHFIIYNYFLSTLFQGKQLKNWKPDTREEDFKKDPHSFIFHRGTVGKNIMHLVTDMRRVMEPYTASSLKVIFSFGKWGQGAGFRFRLFYRSFFIISLTGEKSQCVKRLCQCGWTIECITLFGIQ
jgi:hypothetical protein